MRPSLKGIRYAYPHVPLPTKVKAFIQLLRPFTLLAAVSAGLFLYLATGGSLVRTGLVVGLALALLQASGQCLNQSVEREILIDIANGKTWRPTVRGLITPREGKVTSAVLALLGVGLALSLNIVYGAFATVIALFALLYTWVKPYFVVNNLWQATSRGFLPFVAVMWSFGEFGSVTPVMLGLACATWVFFFQTTKDWGDAVGDRMYGIRTFPVVLGKRGTHWLLSIGIFAWAVFLPGTGFELLSLLALPSVAIWVSLWKGWVVPQMENNAGWCIYYVTLGLWCLGACVIA